MCWLQKLVNVHTRHEAARVPCYSVAGWLAGPQGVTGKPLGSSQWDTMPSLGRMQNTTRFTVQRGIKSSNPEVWLQESWQCQET